MAARPGQPMLTLVEPAELEARRARRHPDHASRLADEETM
jgi:hypothetical protein